MYDEDYLFNEGEEGREGGGGWPDGRKTKKESDRKKGEQRNTDL